MTVWAASMAVPMARVWASPACAAATAAAATAAAARHVAEQALSQPRPPRCDPPEWLGTMDHRHTHTLATLGRVCRLQDHQPRAACHEADLRRDDERRFPHLDVDEGFDQPPWVACRASRSPRVQLLWLR